MLFPIFITLNLIFTIVTCQNCTHRNSTILWLMKYNFTDTKYDVNNNSLVDGCSLIKESVKKFQYAAGFPVTGYLDKTQIEAMNKPICLTTNVRGLDNRIKQIRYWGKRSLTWRYFPPFNGFKIPNYLMELIIQKVFDIWTKNIPLTVTKESKNQRADFNVRFFSKQHNDYNPFDGPGGVLGHAYFPESGEIHLDLDENWGIYGDERFKGVIDLFSVLYHEVGHSLGLPHSPFYLNTIMRSSSTTPKYPWQIYVANPLDDLAIRRIYLPNNQLPNIHPYDTRTKEIFIQSRTTELQPHKPNRNRPKLIPKPYEPQRTRQYFDTAFSVLNELVLLKDNKIWRINYHGIVPQYPMNIHRFFRGINNLNVIDSIYQRWVDHIIVIFSNDQYYKFYGNRLLDGYPKSIYSLLGRHARINRIIPVLDNQYLVFYLDSSRLFLFNEHTNTVIYTVDLNQNYNHNLAINSNNTNNNNIEFINKNDIYINSAAKINFFYTVLITLMLLQTIV